MNLRASRSSRTRKTPALQAKSDEELLGVGGVRLVKVAPYSFMTAHVCRQMRKNAHKMNANILRLLRRMFLKVCTVHDSNSSNSIFSKISIERILLKLKIFSMQILKHFHRRKFKKLSEK